MHVTCDVTHHATRHVTSGGARLKDHVDTGENFKYLELIFGFTDKFIK